MNRFDYKIHLEYQYQLLILIVIVNFQVFEHNLEAEDQQIFKDLPNLYISYKYNKVFYEYFLHLI